MPYNEAMTKPQVLGQRIQTKEGKLRIIATWKSAVFYGKVYTVLHNEDFDRFIAVVERGKIVTPTTPLRPYTGQPIPRDAQRYKGIQRYRDLQKKDPK